jgi:hypothetical protein
MDLMTAAYRRLTSDPGFQALVGPDVGTDSTAGAWVFQGLEENGVPFRDVESTGKAAVVLMVQDAWAAANKHNSAMFPQLVVLIYADLSRSADKTPVRRDARARCERIFRVVDQVFHDSANQSHWWPSEGAPDRLYIHSCLRQGGWVSITDVPLGDGVVRGTVAYEVSLS